VDLREALMSYEGLLDRIAECDDLAKHANDPSIREKSAELAEMYRELAGKARGEDSIAARELVSSAD
jgi:hypothetical protein